MSSDASPVEELLARWVKRNPASPVRAVVQRAEALGFTPVLPHDSRRPKHLELLLGDTTLQVTPLELTVADAGVRAVVAGLPGAVTTADDVQLPFAAADPFAALEAVHRATAGMPDLTWPQVSVEAALQEKRSHVVLASVAAVVLMLVVIGAVTSGFAGAAVMLGLAAFVVGLAAVVVGRARWAFIASRRAATGVLAAGLVALVAGGATLPATETDTASSAAASSAAASSSAAEKAAKAAQDAAEAAAQEAAIEAAEAALLNAEDAASTTASTAVNAATGLLTDAATDTAVNAAQPTTALAALAAVPVQGRAPKTGYDRDLFGSGWVDVDRNGCDTRNDVLARDLSAETFKPGTRNCLVLTGSLADPYSGKTIAFQRGQKTSEAVQIDHVVALSNSWQTGAQAWDAARRTAFGNDPLNLLAVDGPLNMQKGDGDAATWLPPNKGYRCAYVARQVAVKVSYELWMTQAERNAIATVLTACPDEPLPGGVVAHVPARTTAAATTADPAPAPRTTATPQRPAAVVPVPAPAPDPEPAPPAPVVVPEPAPEPEPEPVAGVYYENCDAVRAAGAAPIYPGDPGWQPKFDRNKDGVGCEN